MSSKDTRKIIIITAPSGSGKTTLVNYLLSHLKNVAFSVSACTRKPRTNEINGEAYYFYSIQEFKKLIAENAFAEWEMVYDGKYYGTLHSELNRIWNNKKTPLCDIDVQGALRLQEQFNQQSLCIFIQPPSLQVLRTRLENRNTDSIDAINERIKKAENELTYSTYFSHIIVNEDLNLACRQLLELVVSYLEK